MQKHVEISVIAFPESIEDLPRIKNELVAFASLIAGYWQPIKTWSQISLLISQNGANLAAATTAALILMIGYYLFETRKKLKANMSAYQKLSRANRQIIDIVQQTEKKTLPTLGNIATTHKEKVGKEINRDRLLKMLSGIENTGVVKGSVANRQDEPIRVWATQFRLDKI
jgi:hypothetical protein